MSEWDALDEDMTSYGANGNGNDDDVEYVGTVEEDVSAAPHVQAPRRPVRRVVPQRPRFQQAATLGAESAPIRRGNGDKGGQMYYYDMENGARFAMNGEAAQRAAGSPVVNVGGRAARRVQPGTYVTYGPSIGPSGLYGGGMGNDGDMGMGTNGSRAGGIMEGIGSILAPLSELGVGIATTVTGHQRAEAEMELEAQLRREQMEAESEARDMAFQTEQLARQQEHELRLEELSQRAEELRALRETEAAVSSAPSTTAAPIVTQQGTSPVVWIFLALVLAGGVGGVFWYMSKKKDEEE
jgi:hypothetical protein